MEEHVYPVGIRQPGGAMKVYGITDDNLDHIEDNLQSSSRHWGVVTFVCGALANVFTNYIFQEQMSKAAYASAGVTAMACVLVGWWAWGIAKRDDKRRAFLIAKIKTDSIYIDPKNEDVMKLLEQIRTVTSGTNEPQRSA